MSHCEFILSVFAVTKLYCIVAFILTFGDAILKVKCVLWKKNPVFEPLVAATMIQGYKVNYLHENFSNNSYLWLLYGHLVKIVLTKQI